MPCTDPRTVGFYEDGKTICWSPKKYSREYAIFQLPCGQCLECRLQYARSWAVRCVHEAQMHEKNSFITLTYADEHLSSPKLVYADFQKFMKRLRKTQNDPIGVFVTGEYGEQTKRPHWHAILFGYDPSDKRPHGKNDRGDQLFKSDVLDRIWGKNDAKLRPNLIGEVTLESAGYCARYAAKKLVHGRDDDHDFHPISKKSSKHAIGKKWLERYYPDVFSHGRIIHEGIQLPIPRYYEKWFKENKPQEWLAYVTRVKLERLAEATARNQAKTLEWLEANHKRRDQGRSDQLTDNQVRKLIQQKKFDQLQAYLKL